MQISTWHAVFFPFCLKEWNQLNDDFKKIESIKKFKEMLIKVIRTKENSVFGFYDTKLLTRLKLNFSHLNEHKFRQNFKYAENPMCNCVAATKTTIQYLLCCWLYSV